MPVRKIWVDCICPKCRKQYKRPAPTDKWRYCPACKLAISAEAIVDEHEETYSVGYL